MSEQLKQCSKCHVVKGVELFKPKRGECKGCRKEYQRKRSQSPEVKEARREYHHKRSQLPEWKEYHRNLYHLHSAPSIATTQFFQLLSLPSTLTKTKQKLETK